MEFKKLFFALSLGLFAIGAGCAPATDTDTTTDTPTETEGEIARHEDDLIWVDAPRIDDEVSSPLTITGEARGNWYFEASFPVKLLDASGATIATGHATATEDWQTTDYVPFTATLTFTAPASGEGTLVLQKDNPSGDPERDDQLEVPVRF